MLKIILVPNHLRPDPRPFPNTVQFLIERSDNSMSVALDRYCIPLLVRPTLMRSSRLMMRDDLLVRDPFAFCCADEMLRRN